MIRKSIKHRFLLVIIDKIILRSRMAQLFNLERR